MRTSLIVVVVAASLAACGGVQGPEAGSESQAVTVAAGAAGTPDLPDCAHVPVPAAGRVVTVSELGTSGLIEALVDGKPLCIDTVEGAAAAGILPSSGAKGGGGSGSSGSGASPDPSQGGGGSGSGTSGNGPTAPGKGNGSSDPMPGKGGDTSSDPMPGDNRSGK
jgi:hypothetical protein